MRHLIIDIEYNLHDTCNVCSKLYYMPSTLRKDFALSATGLRRWAKTVASAAIRL